MELTITETLVRNKERRRRCLQAQKERKTIRQIALEEGNGRFANNLANKLVTYLSDDFSEQFIDSSKQYSKEIREKESNPVIQAKTPESKIYQSLKNEPQKTDSKDTIENTSISNKLNTILDPDSTPPSCNSTTAGSTKSSNQSSNPGHNLNIALCEDIKKIRKLLECFVKEFTAFNLAFARSSNFQCTTPPDTAPTLESAPERSQPETIKKKVKMGDITGMIDQLQDYFK